MLKLQTHSGFHDLFLNYAFDFYFYCHYIITELSLFALYNIRNSSTINFSFYMCVLICNQPILISGFGE